MASASLSGYRGCAQFSMVKGAINASTPAQRLTTRPSTGSPRLQRPSSLDLKTVGSLASGGPTWSSRPSSTHSGVVLLSFFQGGPPLSTGTPPNHSTSHHRHFQQCLGQCILPIFEGRAPQANGNTTHHSTGTPPNTQREHYPPTQRDPGRIPYARPPEAWRECLRVSVSARVSPPGGSA